MTENVSRTQKEFFSEFGRILASHYGEMYSGSTNEDNPADLASLDFARYLRALALMRIFLKKNLLSKPIYLSLAYTLWNTD